MASQQRTYQDAKGPYQLPNDATEHDRLDAQSASLIALMNNKPIHAPLTTPKRILDIGCGTGAMTVILAKLYPQAEVIGVDIAPVPQNRHGQQPSNVTFIQGNVRQLIETQDSKFQPGSFDFVFERLLILGITDWPGHISAISSLLKPGGWLECQEFTWMMYSTSGVRLFDSQPFYDTVNEDAKAIGLNVEIGDELADTFRSVGEFKEVKEAVYECAPIARADRPELFGLEEQILGLFQLLINKMCSGRRSKEKIAKLEAELDEMWRKLDGTERHRIYVVSGQKK